MRKNDLLTKMTHKAAENASRALSKLSDEKVKVEVSKTEVTKIQRIFPGIGPETIVAGIYLPVTGEVKGASLLIFPEDVAYVICDLLLKRKPGTTRRLTELDESALKEVGNILCGSFLTIFSNTLKVKIVENVPSFSFDMFGAVVDKIIAQFAQRAEDALVIEVKFDFEHTQIKGYVVLIFGLEEMKALISALEKAELER
jgi:chemotaxis protein CheC